MPTRCLRLKNIIALKYDLTFYFVNRNLQLTSRLVKNELLKCLYIDFGTKIMIICYTVFIDQCQINTFSDLLNLKLLIDK